MEAGKITKVHVKIERFVTREPDPAFYGTGASHDKVNVYPRISFNIESPGPLQDRDKIPAMAGSQLPHPGRIKKRFAEVESRFRQSWSRLREGMTISEVQSALKAVIPLAFKVENPSGTKNNPAISDISSPIGLRARLFFIEGKLAHRYPQEF